MKQLPYLRSFRIVAPPEKISLVEDLLRAEAFEFEEEPFSPFCRRLLSEPKALGSSLAAFFGYIYIQDRSSMLPPLALNPPSGAAILDMCASPGSKSGFLAQLGGPESFVLANEPNPARLDTLRANMRQINMLNVGTCSYPGEKLPLAAASCSHILLDPPCSGWGTEDKNPSARKIWQGEKIGALVKIQRRLLERAADLLAPGGSLLYSTCTTNQAENEDQAKYALEYLGLTQTPLQPFPGFHFASDSALGGDLLVSGRDSAAQGFYLCLLRKENTKEDSTTHPGPGQTDESLPALSIEPDLPANPLFDPQALPPGNVRLFGRQLRFLPAQSSLIINEDIKWQAPLLGTMSGGKSPRFILDPRSHALLDPSSPARIQMDDIREIHALLTGRSIKADSKFPELALWWRDLPLCSMSQKGGRIIPAFH